MSSFTKFENESNVGDQVLSVLNQTGFPYEVIEIDPDYADTEAFCEKYGYPVDTSGNTIIVASRREPFQYSACLVKASDRLDVNVRVRKLMGVRRLSFATREQTIKLTGMEIGGVTPFALPDDLPVYVDVKIMELDYVILGSGVRSSKIKAAPEILRKIVNTNVLPGIAIDSN